MPATVSNSNSSYAFGGWYYNGTKVENGVTAKSFAPHELTAKWVLVTWGEKYFEVDDKEINIGNEKHTETIDTDLNPDDLKDIGFNNLTITLKVRGWRKNALNSGNSPYVGINDVDRTIHIIQTYSSFPKEDSDGNTKTITFSIPTSILSQDGKFLIDFYSFDQKWILDRFYVSLTACP